MVQRPIHLATLRDLIARNPVVTLLGARQVGKSTLARALAVNEAAAWFDTENPRDAARLDDPLGALEALRGLVVIDEAQRMPGLFPVLRVLADRAPCPARFLLLGSISPVLVRGVSESLAGRVAFTQLPPFGLDEVGPMARLWLRGGFPRAFLAESDALSLDWRADFIATFLERDLAALGIDLPPATLRRFWMMLAHWHGQRWNASEIARNFGISDKTSTRWLDALTGVYMVRQLPAWHENISSRQVKAPKVYLADSGLLHALLGLATLEELECHPKVGASWEGFALEAVIRALGARPAECFHWATQGGAELDLLVVRGTRRLGFAFKRHSAPTRTRSMVESVARLGLDRLDVLYPGEIPYALGERIRAVPLAAVTSEAWVNEAWRGAPALDPPA